MGKPVYILPEKKPANSLFFHINRITKYDNLCAEYYIMHVLLSSLYSQQFVTLTLTV